MAIYTQNVVDSRFDAEQWTGNIDPIRRLINQNVTPRSEDEMIRADLPNARYQVHDGVNNPDMAGWLCVWQYRVFAVEIPPNHWAVYGPIIRGAKTGGSLRVISPEEFSLEFTLTPV